MFSCESYEISKSTFFTEYLRTTTSKSFLSYLFKLEVQFERKINASSSNESSETKFQIEFKM